MHVGLTKFFEIQCCTFRGIMFKKNEFRVHLIYYLVITFGKYDLFSYTRPMGSNIFDMFDSFDRNLYKRTVLLLITRNARLVDHKNSFFCIRFRWQFSNSLSRLFNIHSACLSEHIFSQNKLARKILFEN